MPFYNLPSPLNEAKFIDVAKISVKHPTSPFPNHLPIKPGRPPPPNNMSQLIPSPVILHIILQIERSLRLNCERSP